MSGRLALPADKIIYHPNGITTEGIEPNAEPPVSPSLGYLARLSPLKGLDLLVDAFIALKESGKHDNLQLKIAGGMTAEDQPFVEEQRNKLVRAGFNDFFSISPNITRRGEIKFPQKLVSFFGACPLSGSFWIICRRSDACWDSGSVT